MEDFRFEDFKVWELVGFGRFVDSMVPCLGSSL